MKKHFPVLQRRAIQNGTIHERILINIKGCANVPAIIFLSRLFPFSLESLREDIPGCSHGDPDVVSRQRCAPEARAELLRVR